MSWYNRGPLYLCDPNKNTECSKSSCQWACRMTTKKEYSVDGRPLTEEEAKKIEEEADAEYERRDSCREILQELKDRETPRKSHIPWLYELDTEETEKTWERDESKHTFEKPADDAGRFW